MRVPLLGAGDIFGEFGLLLREDIYRSLQKISATKGSAYVEHATWKRRYRVVQKLSTPLGGAYFELTTQL